MHCPTSLSPTHDVFKGVIETIAKRKTPHPDIFIVCLQQNIEKSILSQFNQNKIPIYPTPERAVRAFMHLLKCENEKKFIDKSPHKPMKVRENVSQLLKVLVKKKEQEWLDHHVIQEILTAYGIPVIKTMFASSPAKARAVSQKMEFPLVLKIASKDIVHKSDVGGVILNLSTPEEVEESAQNMLKTVFAYQPQARIEGFVLQPMVPLDHGFELFLGGIRDKTFGPVVIFGAGGKAVEVVNDKALALAPLTEKSALDLIEQTRNYAQLKGYRDQEPIPLDLLIDCLVKLSYLLVNHPEITELDINPLLADTKKVLVLDTRMRLSSSPF
jgi:acetyltransferase